MTLQEYDKKLQELYGVTDSIVNLVIAPNGIKMLLSIIRRIQKEGKSATGGSIGSYSTKPDYFAKSGFLNVGAFRPEGKSPSGDILVPSYFLGTFGYVAQPLTKTGKPVKRATKRFVQVKTNYQQRTSMYLPGGYKEYRQIQGLQTGHVDLKYSGKLFDDFQAETDETGMNIGFTTIRSSLIRQGQEKKWGQPIFSPSAQEIKTYSDAVNFSLSKLTRDTFEGITAVGSVQIPDAA